MKVYLRFIPMMIIMGIIFYLSHLPGDFVHFRPLPGIDKLLHFIAYAVLAASCIYGLHPRIHESRRTFTVITVVLFCLIYGISDEFHQSFVPGRSVSAWDVAADACGALFAGFIWYWSTSAKDVQRDSR